MFYLNASPERRMSLCLDYHFIRNTIHRYRNVKSNSSCDPDALITGHAFYGFSANAVQIAYNANVSEFLFIQIVDPFQPCNTFFIVAVMFFFGLVSTIFWFWKFNVTWIVDGVLPDDCWTTARRIRWNQTISHRCVTNEVEYDPRTQTHIRTAGVKTKPKITVSFAWIPICRTNIKKSIYKSFDIFFFSLFTANIFRSYDEFRRMCAIPR